MRRVWWMFGVLVFMILAYPEALGGLAFPLLLVLGTAWALHRHDARSGRH